MMSDIYNRLKAPFPPDAVSWRVGSTNREKTKGMALAYIDARDVMNRLDEVCGPAGWMDRYEFHGSRTVCYLSIAIPTINRPDGEWITKADGAGDSDVEAEKGSISDAFKRAAVKWGIGRYLYDLPSTWVELDERKQIKPFEMDKLRRVLIPVNPVVPAPPAKPSKAAPAKAIAAYVETFRFALGRCDVESEVRMLWSEQAKERAKLGIGKDHEAYVLMAGLCKDRIEEVGAADRDAETMGMP